MNEPPDRSTSELLSEAIEFVDYVAGIQRDGESFITTGIAMSEPTRLRRKADAIERHDAQILRARALQKKIKDHLS